MHVRTNVLRHFLSKYILYSNKLLKGNGEDMNQRIAIIGDNSIEYVRHLFSIWENGDCAVLIERSIPPKSAVEMMESAHVVSCYIEEKMITSEYRDNGIKLIPYVSPQERVSRLPPKIMQMYQGSYSRNDAVIIFSSGTTGKEKGIILSHYAISVNSDMVVEQLNATQSDSICILRSFAHSSSLVCELIASIKANMSIILCSQLMHPRVIWKTIKENEVTVLFVNPTLLSILINEQYVQPNDTQSLRVIYSSGAPLSKQLINRARLCLKKVSIFNAYGLTEAGPRVCSQTNHYCSENSVGPPLSGVQVKVVTQMGKIAEVNEVGKIYVKTSSIFTSYIDGSNGNIKDGWLYTKDMGYISATGELYICGRVDDIINSGGHKINPNVVENIILQSPQPIYDCAVIGEEDLEMGEQLICILYAEQDINLQVVISFCNEMLASYEIPSKWVLWNEPFCRHNGKLNRKHLKEQYRKEKKIYEQNGRRNSY